MLHGVMLNGTLGVISGLGNVTPKTLVNVFDLFKAGKIEEAKRAQVAVSLAGELELKGGVPGMRVSEKLEVVDCLGSSADLYRAFQYGCVRYFGYGGVCRR
jgi:hypothetical protein